MTDEDAALAFQLGMEEEEELARLRLQERDDELLAQMILQDELKELQNHQQPFQSQTSASHEKSYEKHNDWGETFVHALEELDSEMAATLSNCVAQEEQDRYLAEWYAYEEFRIQCQEETKHSNQHKQTEGNKNRETPSLGAAMVQCGTCGAHLHVRKTTTWANCPYCRATQYVPPQRNP